MRGNVDHIATSHVGSLPRPDGLIAVHRAHEAGEPVDEAAFEVTQRAAVAEVVRRQRDLGIDIPGDGEFGKPMAQRVQYRLVVALLVAAARRAPDPRGQPVRHGASAVSAWRGCADQFWRSARSQTIRCGLCRS